MWIRRLLLLCKCSLSLTVKLRITSNRLGRKEWVHWRRGLTGKRLTIRVRIRLVNPNPNPGRNPNPNSSRDPNTNHNWNLTLSIMLNLRRFDNYWLSLFKSESLLVGYSHTAEAKKWALLSNIEKWTDL